MTSTNMLQGVAGGWRWRGGGWRRAASRRRRVPGCRARRHRPRRRADPPAAGLRPPAAAGPAAAGPRPAGARHGGDAAADHRAGDRAGARPAGWLRLRRLRPERAGKRAAQPLHQCARRDAGGRAAGGGDARCQPLGGRAAAATDAAPAPSWRSRSPTPAAACRPRSWSHVLEPFSHQADRSGHGGWGYQVTACGQSAARAIDSCPGGHDVRLWLNPSRRGGRRRGGVGRARRHPRKAARDALLVDDETGVRPVAARCATWLLVAEAPDALRLALLAAGLAPNLLLTDVGMPGGMDGVAPARRAAHAARPADAVHDRSPSTAAAGGRGDRQALRLDALTARVRARWRRAAAAAGTARPDGGAPRPSARPALPSRAAAGRLRPGGSPPVGPSRRRSPLRRVALRVAPGPRCRTAAAGGRGARRGGARAGFARRRAARPAAAMVCTAAPRRGARPATGGARQRDVSVPRVVSGRGEASDQRFPPRAAPRERAAIASAPRAAGSARAWRLLGVSAICGRSAAVWRDISPDPAPAAFPVKAWPWCPAQPCGGDVGTGLRFHSPRREAPAASGRAAADPSRAERQQVGALQPRRRRLDARGAKITAGIAAQH